MKTQLLLTALLLATTSLGALNVQAVQPYGEGNPIDPSPLYGDGAPLAEGSCNVGDVDPFVSSGDPVWDALCHAVFSVFPDAQFADRFPDNANNANDDDDYNTDEQGRLDDDLDGRPDAAFVLSVTAQITINIFVQLDFFNDRPGAEGQTTFYNPDTSETEFDFGLQPMLYIPTSRAKVTDHDQIRVASVLTRDGVTYTPAIYDASNDDGSLFCLLCVLPEDNALIAAIYASPSNTGTVSLGRYETFIDIDLADDSIEERHETNAKSVIKMDSQWVYEDGQEWRDSRSTIFGGEKHIKEDGIRTPTLQDVDDDGWTDFEEQQCGSNPTRWQSTCDDWDGDGVGNEAEQTDPNRSPFQDDDFDQDGILNNADNCNPGDEQIGSPAAATGATTANNGQDDLDGDGIGDQCDNDWDGDGVRNTQLAPRDDFPRCDQGTHDTDRDGKPDVVSAGNGVCDQTLYPTGLVPDDDDDNDTVLDSVDNCRVHDNPGQENTDKDLAANGNRHVVSWDELGDACDSDRDGDGIPNSASGNNNDEADFGTDPLKPDTDGDGLPDAFETGDTVVLVNALVSSDPNTDPLDRDTDDDGLSDCEEVFHTVASECEDPAFTGPFDGGFDTDSNTADTDGDGLTDCQEVRHTVAAECADPAFAGAFDGGYGTDPTNDDTDGDGVPDGHEVGGTLLAPSDPNDPEDPSFIPAVVLLDPVKVLFNPDCHYLDSAGSEYDPAECEMSVEAPQTFLDDKDPYDTDGDGITEEPNGQIDQIEEAAIFYDDAADDEGGHTPYTAPFKGSGTFTVVIFEDPLGPPGSPFRDAHVISRGDAAATDETEVLVIQTTYEARASGRGTAVESVTYGFSETWCVIEEDGGFAVYTGNQAFNEADAEHPCGQKYSWTDTFHEVEDQFVKNAYWEWFYDAQCDEDGDVKDNEWECPTPIVFHDDDRDNVPESISIRHPAMDSCIVGQGAAVLDFCPLEPYETTNIPLGGVPSLDDLCEEGETFPGCLGGDPLADEDMDDVPDAVDECPGEEGPPANGGCPEEPVDPEGDDDGDGVRNADDECPGTPEGAPVDENGCESAGGLNDLCPDGGEFPTCLGTDPFPVLDEALGIQECQPPVSSEEPIFICRIPGDKAPGDPIYLVLIAGIIPIQV